MAALSMSETELLEALALAAPGTAPEHARTVRELAASAGVSHDVVIDRIRALHRSGKIAVHSVERTDITGRLIRVPAYTFKS